MNKKNLMLITWMAVAMVALPTSTAFATKPTPVAGTFFPAGLPSIETRQPGMSDNTIYEISGAQMWTGSFVGIATTESVFFVHKSSDEDAPGAHITSRSTFTLDVEYGGLEGTLTIKGAESHWRIISGTGDLANLRGKGTFTLINPDIMLMSYEGKVHFNP